LAARAALALGLLGLAYRLILALLVVPPTSSDEAFTGLAAIHIAAGRDYPVYYYGQHYMGTVEAYLAAPLFALFGPSTVLLRVPLLALYAGFGYLMYRLTRRLYPRWLAVGTVGLLALGSQRVLMGQLLALGGYPEILPAGALLMLLAVHLGERGAAGGLPAVGLFGLVAGVCVWDGWLVAPYLAVAAGILAYGAGRYLLGPAGAVLLAGFLFGVAPLVLDNLTAPPGQDTLSVLRALGAPGVGSWAWRWHGAVPLGVPLSGGLCPLTGCSGWQTWWGWAYPVLLAWSGGLALAGWRRAGPERAARIRYAAQFGLVLAAGLTIFSYARSAGPVSAPLDSVRYLSCLLISTPAVLWPLCWSARRLARAGPALRRLAPLAMAPLAAVAAAMLAATGLLVGQAGTLHGWQAPARALADGLDRAGLTRVYSEYWTCARLTFQTRERVVCAVLGVDLRPGQNRYQPYWDEVRAAPNPAFVLPAGQPIDLAVQRYLRDARRSATVTEVAGYRVYRPSAPVPLP
jgi:hypothetical protein